MAKTIVLEEYAKQRSKRIGLFKKYGVTAYYDYKELIEKEKPDIVHVCVPHYLHPIISKYALEQGVNVLCEKPMAIKYEDAIANVKLAKEKGYKNIVIFCDDGISGVTMDRPDFNKMIELLSERSTQKRIAVICYEGDVSTVRSKAPTAYIYRFGEKDDEVTHAHLLFDILRDADKRGFDEIYAPLPRAEGIGLALYNRMIRAAAYHIIRM